MNLHTTDFGGAGTPLVILHGLFGSSRNWTSVGKALAAHAHPFALDLRNHGKSPHTPTHRLVDMVADLGEWCDAHRADASASEAPILLGHSMGGLVAMAYALQNPDRVRGLIVVDIPPRASARTHSGVMAALRMDLARFSSREEIDRALAEDIPEKAARDFIQTNIERGPEGFRWVINAEALRNSDYDESFPAGGTYDGPVQFIIGEKSDYFSGSDGDLARKFFPAARIASIPGAGHLPHFTHAGEFLALVEDFIVSAAASR